MIDEKSIWDAINKWRWFRLFLSLSWLTRSRYEMLVIKKADSDFSFLLFWSFNFCSLNLSFFSLVVSCACIWQLVTIFILLSNFCSSRCVLSLCSAQFFLIYICHISFFFDEKKKNRIAVLWWCEDERIDIFKRSKDQQWQSFEESWVWYRNKLWSNVTFLTWMSLRALFCWFDKLLKAFAKNIFRWNRYDRRNVDTSSCDLRTAKHFMKNIVRDCFTESKRASMYTML